MNKLGFNAALLEWFERVKRPMPWRDTCDPYIHWVSEIMLQQTQVATVLPYFSRWMAAFPTVEALAKAEHEEVLALWSGLGYYRRARLLHEGAKFVVAHGWPQSAHQWRSVPGVGEYTAGAIASMTDGEPVPAVDGNVQRVFARLTQSGLGGSALVRNTSFWAQENLDPSRPGEWNEAVMELGATVCRPRSPDCPSCPVSAYCEAFLAGTQADYPVRSLREPATELEFLVWIPVCDGMLGLCQIQSGPWWHGLWEFPRAACGFHAEAELRKLVGEARLSVELGTVKSTVTKHKLRFHARLVSPDNRSPHLEWYEPEEAKLLPLPSAQRRLLVLVSSALRTGAEVDSAPDCSL